MPGVKGVNESEGEEIDPETAESDKSSNEDSDSSGSGSGSDDESSSEVDEECIDKRRSECLHQMADLEKQFVFMKEQLFEEKSSQIDIQLEEEVSDILKVLRLTNIRHTLDAENQASKQNLNSEKALLWDVIKCDLEDKIRRLEEDRNSVDITSDLWNEQVNLKRNKRKCDSQFVGKRKKPVTVSGPYIALKASKQSSEYEFHAPERVSCRFADGKLVFKGASFRKGESVYIDDKTQQPWQARVISVNTSEVLLQKVDGGYSRIGIGDLQCGKYIISHQEIC
ncbi:hypothetical protein CEXT_562652 [Caerostris extrusa]|uniref:Uncharacterized protein n=1 Tax=Caerostris extrusa TaxID=172846 RepID=A0AAV4XIT5_CAEEX|nr:hypothetical protein CEXT_562652 [Caerostris extrusa]